jgi:hypothetical protein
VHHLSPIRTTCLWPPQWLATQRSGQDTAGPPNLVYRLPLSLISSLKINSKTQLIHILEAHDNKPLKQNQTPKSKDAQRPALHHDIEVDLLGYLQDEPPRRFHVCSSFPPLMANRRWGRPMLEGVELISRLALCMGAGLEEA